MRRSLPLLARFYHDWRVFAALWRARPANLRNMAVCMALVLCMALLGSGVDTWLVMPQHERVAVKEGTRRARVAVARGGGEAYKALGRLLVRK